MKCPVDNAVLQMTNRGPVSIDYCPECRGVWLDRNELDKIMEEERGVRDHTASREVRPQTSEYDSRQHQSYQKPHKKKESFLADMFDF